MSDKHVVDRIPELGTKPNGKPLEYSGFLKLGVAVHICNPSTQKAEAGG
jgi:hypothetical protein